MAAITLWQAAFDLANNGQGMAAAMLKKFAESSPVLPYLPFSTLEMGLTKTWSSLASVSEAQYDGVDQEDFAGGTEEYLSESVDLKRLSDQCTIPQVYADQGMSASLDQRSLLMMTRAALTFTRHFFQGDSQANPKEINGLRALIGSSSTQLIDAGATSGGDALSLLKLDELIAAISPIMPGETPVIYANETIIRLLTQAARKDSIHNMVWTRNEFGQQVTQYNGIPLVPVYAAADKTLILPFTEANPGGGTAASTSIYAVKFGDTSLKGIQGNKGMELIDYQTARKDAIGRRFVWLHNLQVVNSGSIARLRGVKNAAVVA